MKILFIINEPPYGNERSYNALRLALALLKEDPIPEVTVFLMADAVSCAKAGQKTPDGYYNIERMLKGVGLKADILLCGTCMEARGLKDDELVRGTKSSTMPELARLTMEADKVLTF